MKRTLHRALSMLLTAAMALNMGLTPVFAEGANPPGTSGVCTHHTEHTEDCGYAAGTPCNHAHTEECYTKELTCTLVEGAAPEIATDSDAVLDSGVAPAGEVHSHGEDCYAQTENCPHEHDDACGYTPDSPCTFDPASCEQCNIGDKPAEKVCTCEPALGASDVGHGEDCPLYTVKDSGAYARAAGVMNGAELFAAVNDAADGDTISLGDSFELTDMFLSIENKAITLDLNGKTLTAGDGGPGIWVDDTGALILSDSGDGGKVVGSVIGSLIVNRGQLTMNGGTVENTEGTAIQNQDTGTLIVTGGEVKAANINSVALGNTGSVTVGGNAKISGEGGAISNGNDGTVTVEGNATVTMTNTQPSDNNNAISNSDTGTVNINGGTVQNAGDGTVILNSNTGTINVNGGEVISPGSVDDNEAIAINNTSTGTINVTGGKLMARGNDYGYAIRSQTMSGDDQPAGTVNVTGGELVATGTRGTAISCGTGTLAISGDAIVRATGDGGIAVSTYSSTVTVNGSALVEATGDTVMDSSGMGNSTAIHSEGTEGTITVGGSALVRATKDEGIAVVNLLTFTLEGDAVVEALGVDGMAIRNGGTCTINGGTVQTLAQKSRAIYNDINGTCTINGGTVLASAQESRAIMNGGTCTINGGTVQALGLESSAVSNERDMHIYGGEIIGTIANKDTNQPICVYPSTTLSANAIGLPVIFGTDTDWRIAVFRASRESAEMILEFAAAAVPGASLPDAGDPLGFFVFSLESKNNNGEWEQVDGGLPEGAALLLPFPAGADEYSNNYKVVNFSDSTTPTVLSAVGKEYGIECDPPASARLCRLNSPDI